MEIHTVFSKIPNTKQELRTKDFAFLKPILYNLLLFFLLIRPQFPLPQSKTYLELKQCYFNTIDSIFFLTLPLHSLISPLQFKHGPNVTLKPSVIT